MCAEKKKPFDANLGALALTGTQIHQGKQNINAYFSTRRNHSV